MRGQRRLGVGTTRGGVPSSLTAAPSAIPHRGPQLDRGRWPPARGPRVRSRSGAQGAGGARTRQRGRGDSAEGGAGGSGGAARRAGEGWLGRQRLGVQAYPTAESGFAAGEAGAAGARVRGAGGGAPARAGAGRSASEHRREAVGTADSAPGSTSDSAGRLASRLEAARGLCPPGSRISTLLVPGSPPRAPEPSPGLVLGVKPRPGRRKALLEIRPGLRPQASTSSLSPAP